MIEFAPLPEKILPYDRSSYIAYLSDEVDSEWQGVSFQIDSSRGHVSQEGALAEYKNLTENTIQQFDGEDHWVVNHDDKDLAWLRAGSERLAALSAAFSSNGVAGNFTGALIVDKNQLIGLLDDLILYPYMLSYKNIDISHGKIPFVIKISSHFNVDLLTPDKKLLQTIAGRVSLPIFKVLNYSGSVDIKFPGN
ncbi:MAG: hypothetical protein KF744_11540 [Taibaiella sp.]|nr:hypothetical protein [Taibaiella sp.]